MDVIYAWQVYEKDEWGTISAFLPMVNAHAQLVTRTRAVAESMRLYAEAHHDRTGLLVRLARFEYVETEVSLP